MGRGETGALRGGLALVLCCLGHPALAQGEAPPGVGAGSEGSPVVDDEGPVGDDRAPDELDLLEDEPVPKRPEAHVEEAPADPTPGEEGAATRAAGADDADAVPPVAPRSRDAGPMGQPFGAAEETSPAPPTTTEESSGPLDEPPLAPRDTAAEPAAEQGSGATKGEGAATDPDDDGLSWWTWTGVAVAGVGATGLFLGTSVVLLAEGVQALSGSYGSEKEFAWFVSWPAVGVAVVGAGVLAVGLGLGTAGLVLE